MEEQTITVFPQKDNIAMTKYVYTLGDGSVHVEYVCQIVDDSPPPPPPPISNTKEIEIIHDENTRSGFDDE